jgi:subtilisin family serine protease
MSENKFVIFVDRDLVVGAAQLAASAGAVSVDAAPTSPEDILRYRRSVLGDLAQSLRFGAVSPAATAQVFGAMTQFAADVVGGVERAAGGFAGVAEGDALQILEGIGALVVDGDAFDVGSLANVVGLTVMPNIEVRLPLPVEAPRDLAIADDWHLRKIGLAPGIPGGDGVLIGVLDTGIDRAHPEFAGKTVHFAEFDALGRQISNVARDAGEHGTHVCSIAAGATAGVAPQAALAVAAVLTTKTPTGMSGSLIQIVNGFNWLVPATFGRANPGVDVINASLGGGGFNIYLQSAVQNARNIGIPLIAAIGNGGRSGIGRHGSPGNYPETLSVGATDNQDQIADFSDWGVAPPPTGPKYPVPELCAPGVNVYAAKPGNQMQYMSGTSMATPIVTGVAARRMASNPALRGKPLALFADLRRQLAPYTPGRFGNMGGAGRIIA